MTKNTCIITGGAGFIGSHLAERLVDNSNVIIIDNLSSGNISNIRNLLNKSHASFLKHDLKNSSSKLIPVIKKAEIIFHLAANPEVRLGETNPEIHLQENILATFNLLEAIRKTKTRKTLVFTSTSTVYGDASKIPTPEDYAPLIPISTYGASKLACEALITSYAHTFNFRALILRLANIVGPRSNHGVIVDFLRKIAQNPRGLEILGDGKQEKSYMYIEDCINAIIHLTNDFLEDEHTVDIYNVGSIDRVSVKEIARIVAEEAGRPNIEFRFTGGILGGRGWKGDVKIMQLDIRKLLSTGWKPNYNSREAVRLAAKELTNEVS